MNLEESAERSDSTKSSALLDAVLRHTQDTDSLEIKVNFIVTSSKKIVQYKIFCFYVVTCKGLKVATLCHNTS